MGSVEDLPAEEEEGGPNERHIHALKLYAINCSQWDSLRLNQLSVNMLFICCLIDCFAKLWVNFFCIEIETIENLSSITFGSVIMLLALPLFLDVSFILI